VLQLDAMYTQCKNHSIFNDDVLADNYKINSLSRDHSDPSYAANITITRNIHDHYQLFSISWLQPILLWLLFIDCLQCFDAVGWVAGRASGLQKTEWWGDGVVVCMEQGADLHTTQLMSLPLTVACFRKIQIGFTFLLLAHPGTPGRRAIKLAVVH